MSSKEKEIKVVNIQLIALLMALISAIISIVITYNQKLDLENKSTIDPKKIFNITVFNRILILLLSLVFLYVNYLCCAR